MDRSSYWLFRTFGNICLVLFVYIRSYFFLYSFSSLKYKLDHDIVSDFLGGGGLLEKSIENLFQNSPTNYWYEYGVNAEVNAFDVYNVLSEY